MITKSDIAQASPEQLIEYRGQLAVARMRMDKFFSVFLNENELPEDTETLAWKTYKGMLEEYETLQSLIKTTEYYISHG